MDNSIFEKVKEILTKSPGHFKSSDMNLTYVCKKYGISIKDFKEVRKILRKGKVMSNLERALDNSNLELEHVKKLKIYGNVDNPMISIHTKDEWYKREGDLISKFEDAIKTNLVIKSRSKIKSESEYCAVISMQDLHLDKIALTEETNNYADINTNVCLALQGFNEILTDVVNYKPKEIIIIAGSDAFNSNDRSRKTVNGTPQDEDYDWYNNFITIYNFYRYCIESAQEHANVHIVMVHGNHDHDKVFYLGQLLKVTFEKNKRVSIDDSRVARKY